MGLRISTNMAALSAQRNLGVNQKRAEHALSAISSGSRIITAADDAAGLAISESLKGQLRGIGAARSNAYQAGSLIQVSEGGLNEINNILIRVRELGIQAASDTVGETERGFLNTEAKAIIQEADRIARTTRVGDKVLLDGSGGKQEYHVGPYGGSENVIGFELSTNATTSALEVDSVSVGTKEDARDSLKYIDNALTKIGAMRANFGAVQNRLNTTVSNLDTQYENIASANSRIRDADVAKESAELASASLLQSAAVSVMAQANSVPQVALKLL